MKIDIVYTTKSKYIKCVADEMARWVKTYAQDLNHYHSDHDVDLLVIGFDDTLFKDKQLLEFIQSLSRQNVKNLALINCFFINNKRLMKVIHLCQNQQLPLRYGKCYTRLLLGARLLFYFLIVIKKY